MLVVMGTVEWNPSAGGGGHDWVEEMAVGMTGWSVSAGTDGHS